MKEVFLLLGSNRGNRQQLLKQARELLAEKAGTILKISTIYETTPWGFDDDTLFLNQAVEIDTNLAPDQLLQELLSIEKQLGRIRPSEAHYQGRTMDIDILFFGNQRIFTDSLIIPHPRLHERFFALQPLAEIAPDFVHPIMQKDIKTLLKMIINS
ncbi:MAG: 2-amino-4-hydroxy-6-hydroxymethyldihydropteridine diphosphokinase [Bacteroidales bacterium]|nr:2-amino-4-hydroxy-6-hydroxymethyldihydropteridine diphosphokinase [Bacteroidales bacterium]